MNEFLQNRFLKSVLTIFIGFSLLFGIGLAVRVVFDPTTLVFEWDQNAAWRMKGPDGISYLDKWNVEFDKKNNVELLQKDPINNNKFDEEMKRIDELRQTEQKKYIEETLKPLWEKEHKSDRAKLWPYFYSSVVVLLIIGFALVLIAIKFDARLGLLGAGIFFAGVNVLNYIPWMARFFMESSSVPLYVTPSVVTKADPLYGAPLVVVAIIAMFAVFAVTWWRFVKQDTPNLEASRFIMVINALAPLAVLMNTAMLLTAWFDMRQLGNTIACFAFALIALTASILARRKLEGISTSLGIAALVATIATVIFSLEYNRMLSVGISFVATLIVMYLGWSAFQHRAEEAAEHAQAPSLKLSGAELQAAPRMVLFGAGEPIPRNAQKVELELMPGILYKGFAVIEKVDQLDEPAE